jgi:hypothetical protein
MGSNDHVSDAAIAKRRELTGTIMEVRLESECYRRNWTLLRLNFKHRGYDVLVIIETRQPDKPDQVAFCNAKDIGAAVRTAYSLMVQDKLRWRDKKEWV